MTTPLIGPIPPPALHVMTLNVRRRIDGFLLGPADMWKRRRGALRTLLRTERPSVLAAQEVLPDQARFVAGSLGASYRYIGHGRGARGEGEGCPVFFDTDRLELRAWAQLALSRTPDVPGSRAWPSIAPRVVVTAQFRDRVTDGLFTVLATHLDPLSRRVRQHAARDILGRIAAAGAPAVALGDLNDVAGSPALRTLLGDGSLADVWTGAEHRLTPAWDTYAGYRRPRETGRRIDWILATPDIRIERAAIHGRAVDGVWPSDHLPVQAVLRMPGTRP